MSAATSKDNPSITLHILEFERCYLRYLHLSLFEVNLQESQPQAPYTLFSLSTMLRF